MRQATGRGRTFYGRSPNESGQHPPELRIGPTRARRRFGGHCGRQEQHPARCILVSRLRPTCSGLAEPGPALPRREPPVLHSGDRTATSTPTPTSTGPFTPSTPFSRPGPTFAGRWSQMASSGGRTNVDLVLRQVGCVPALGVSISSTRMRSANPLLEGAFGILEARLFLYK